jgi:tetratricopeptide (TPR) repeat protein
MITGAASAIMGRSSRRSIRRILFAVRRSIACLALTATTCTVALSSLEGSAHGQQPETLSLLGKPLVAPAIPADRRRTLEADLAAARAAYDKNPEDVDAAIWLGRRTAYLGRFGDAIEIYTRAIEQHADEPRLYRHRGHRYITVRKFDLAIKDLKKAAELVEGKPDQAEPDGQPNARNIPTSTLKSNVYYHLALAHYLKAEFADATNAYRQCLEFSTTPDMRVATTNWLYLSLQRLGLKDDAQRALNPITPDMDVIENQAYLRLLLFDKGLAPHESLKSTTPADAVTIGYGLASASLAGGRIEEGLKQLKSLMDKHANEWPAFGYIAAEADVARLDKRKKPKTKR